MNDTAIKGMAAAAGMLMRDNNSVRTAVVSLARLEELREHVTGQLMRAVEDALPKLLEIDPALAEVVAEPLVDVLEGVAHSYVGERTSDILNADRRPDA